MERNLRQAIAAYAAASSEMELSDVLYPLKLNALENVRRAQHDCLQRGALDQKSLSKAIWPGVTSVLLQLGRMAAVSQGGISPRGAMEPLACGYALGWSLASDRIGRLVLGAIPGRHIWTREDFDPKWEKRREPFVRFVLALYADFAGSTVPPLPAHPYESPAYDALLACWRDPDPQRMVEPLLNVCDWHTHECMYSQSMRPSKEVDFINDTLMGWPVEVHMVYRLRERLGLALPGPLDHPLLQTPFGAFLPPQPVPEDLELQRVVQRAFAELPGLAEVLDGVF
jgi:hypothetical protein